MKNLILATTFLTSFSALANTCFVELQYQGSVLGQNVFEEQTCRDSLRQCKRAEKKYEMEHNLSELECVRLEQTLPLPPSPPTPPRPPRPALINFKGSIDPVITFFKTRCNANNPSIGIFRMSAKIN